MRSVKQIQAIQIIHVIVQCKVIAYVAMIVNAKPMSVKKQFHSYNKKITSFSLFLFSFIIVKSIKH
jgi:hypothetical protein